MDVWHKITNWVDHTRGIVCGILLGIPLSLWLVACTPTVTSLTSPDRQVSGAELQREVMDLQAEITRRQAILQVDAESLAKKAEGAAAELEAKIEQRQKVIEMLGGLGESIASGNVTPGSAIGSIVQIAALLGVGGLAFDNRRKDQAIKVLKDGKT